MRAFPATVLTCALAISGATSATAASAAADASGALSAARVSAEIGAYAAVAAPSTASPSPTPTDPPKPLAGRTIVIDPGHQLGNSRHTKEINKLVDAGRGLRKACNTTGTATNAGYPESTFAWNVAASLKQRLERLGATVVLTRTTNSVDKWGPCIDVRGKIGNAGYQGRDKKANLKISIHGDGSSAGNRGYHLIVASGDEKVNRRSSDYANMARAALDEFGFPRSTYIGKGTAMSVRGDLGTLNWSTMPTVMFELGNMRNANDARVMTSAEGQGTYARAIVKGVKVFYDVDQ